MTSGVGRCFPFWQEVLGCYVVNASAEDDSGKKKCSLALEDYYECLHHKKEVRWAPRASGLRTHRLPHREIWGNSKNPGKLTIEI